MPIEGSAVGKVHGVVQGVGSTVAREVLGTFAQGVAGSHSGATVSGMAEQRPKLADGILVTAAVRSGGLTPSDPGVAVELLAFNASVRRAGEQMGH